jgi:AraC-like DNA-binding protein
MVHATRQYGRWLRDNYADLEHKEVWQSFVILAFILLLFVFYAFISQGPLSQYPMQVFDIVLIGYFLWRVETLSDLSTPVNDTAEEMLTAENVEDNDLSLSIRNRLALPPDMSKNIGLMLQKRCIDTQLYLQHGLTLLQLSQAVGTNRYYLSQYFSSLDMNYNAYINDLRINHFIGLYREALDTERSFTVKQLAMESGFRSYNTFSDAFKRKMGLPVSSWIKAARPQGKGPT